MKRATKQISCILLLALLLSACAPQSSAPAPIVTPRSPATDAPNKPDSPATPISYTHKSGEFRELSVQELMLELGPGYGDSVLGGAFDPTIGYDPYESVPVRFGVSLQARTEQGEDKQSWFARQRLVLGERVAVSISMRDLPNTSDGIGYTHYDFGAQVHAYQDVPITIQVENARIELPGQTISLQQTDGPLETTALYEGPPYKEGSWLWGYIDDGWLDFPEAETLRQGTFLADVTLLAADGPSKAAYYAGYVGNPPISSAEWFAMLKAEGFQYIRFQVTWMNMTDDETYAIDPEWLQMVEQYINLALEEGLYCSINVNWDMCARYSKNFASGMSAEELETLVNGDQGWLTLAGDPKVEERFAAVWGQIAAYFRDYDERLLFECMNEPDGSHEIMLAGGAVFDNDKNAWTKLGEAGENLNRLNQIFVDSVRATGGNSEKRFLLATPFFQRGSEINLKAFRLPDDPAGHTLVGINRYMGDETYGGGDVFDAVDKYLLSKNIGVVFTEFGAEESLYTYEERLAFTRDQVDKARERNIPINWYSSNYGNKKGHPLEYSANFCLYNPYTFEPLFPELIGVLMGAE